MALTNEQLEKLELRARGMLSEAESRELDAELAQSPEAEQEAREHMDLYFAMKAIALRRGLERIHRELAEEGAFDETPAPAEEKDAPVVPLRRANFINWGWLTAASVLLAVFGIGIVNYRHGQNEKLYTKYAATLAEAYVAAPRTMGNVYKSGPAGYYKEFRRGVEQLRRNQPEQAIVSFQAAIESPDRKIREDAEWFLTLAYLKNNNRSNARKLAISIGSQQRHRFQQQATRLQSKL